MSENLDYYESGFSKKTRKHIVKLFQETWIANGNALAETNDKSLARVFNSEFSANVALGNARTLSAQQYNYAFVIPVEPLPYIDCLPIEKYGKSDKANSKPLITIKLRPGSEWCPFSKGIKHPAIITIQDGKMDYTNGVKISKCNLTDEDCRFGLSEYEAPGHCPLIQDNVLVTYKE